MEIRCCCNPERLLGAIEVHHRPGLRWITFSLMGPTPQNIQLEVAEFCLHGEDRYYALKSGHHPIETLRRIQGFKEASEFSPTSESKRRDDATVHALEAALRPEVTELTRNGD